jgi:hypothetical protein
VCTAVSTTPGEAYEQLEPSKGMIRVAWGAAIQVSLQARARSGSPTNEREYAAIKDLPLMVTLDPPKDAEGYGFVVDGKPTVDLRLDMKTGATGIVVAHVQVPSHEQEEQAPAVQRFCLSARPDKGVPVKFWFLVGRPSIKVQGPKYAIVGSQPGYRVTTQPASAIPVAWAIFRHGEVAPVDKGQGKLVDQGQAQIVQPRLKTQEDGLTPAGRAPHQLVVTHKDDEVRFDVHVAKIDLVLLADQAKLGDRLTCSARIFPYLLPGTFEWSWRPPGGDWIRIRESRQLADHWYVDLPRIMRPGVGTLRVEFQPEDPSQVCGGELTKQLEVKAMTIEGPAVLAPGEQGTFQVLPDSLDNVEWFVHQRAPERLESLVRSGLGTAFNWKPGKPGEYELAARWEGWTTVPENQPRHRVVVAYIKGADSIHQDKTEGETYEAVPGQIDGYDAEWSVSYYDFDDRERATERFISPTLEYKADFSYCWLKASFGNKVVLTKRIELSRWRGKEPCEWRWNWEKEE